MITAIVNVLGLLAFFAAYWGIIIWFHDWDRERQIQKREAGKK